MNNYSMLLKHPGSENQSDILTSGRSDSTEHEDWCEHGYSAVSDLHAADSAQNCRFMIMNFRNPPGGPTCNDVSL